MRIVNKKIILASIMLVVVTTGVLIWNLNSDKETQLDSVKLKEEVNSEMFAIMLEQSDGTYIESTDNTWPTEGYTYDASKSGCVDVNGNKIENALAYDATNNIATVETGNTSYCYLYFSLPPNLYELCSEYNNINECAINENLEDVTGIWNSTLESDGYRYVGTNPDNYICFGTNSTEECTNDTEKYMYRIIGIFEDESGVQHLKLIKREPLNTTYKWHEENKEVNWSDSALHIGLNGSYYLSNTTEYPYMADTTWTNKIAEWEYSTVNTITDNPKSQLDAMDSGETWVAANGTNYSYTPVKVSYLHEMNIESKNNETCYYSASTSVDCSVGEWTTVTTKVSLLYVSDYLLSLGESVLDYMAYGNDSIFETGWIYIGNNEGSGDEWTLSRSDISMGTCQTGGGCYWVWRLSNIPKMQLALYSNYVRPVFYTITDTKLSGGSGTITNPYLIAS